MNQSDQYDNHAAVISALVGQGYEVERQSEPISNTELVHLVMVRLKEQPDPDSPVWYNIYYGPDNALDAEDGCTSDGWVGIKCDDEGLKTYMAPELRELLLGMGLVSN